MISISYTDEIYTTILLNFEYTVVRFDQITILTISFLGHEQM